MMRVVAIENEVDKFPASVFITCESTGGRVLTFIESLLPIVLNTSANQHSEWLMSI
jgi:hypothetical protein